MIDFDIQGYNVLILSFYILSGPADQVQEFAALDANTRAQVISEYHAAGISLMMSAFGETEKPTTKGADPVGLALKIANFVKEYGLDGVDVDYEDFAAMNSGTGSAEQWLITFTRTLRDQLPLGLYIITHAPVAPWFTDSSQYPHGAYRTVQSAAGWDIDWYNLQFYNQGGDYQDCNSLLYTSQNDFPHTSVFEINQHAGVPLNRLVIGKPATSGDADGGYMDPGTLAKCLNEAKSSGWSAGAMFWEFPDASAALIKTVRSQSWPV
ncbi:glycoside hydrolase family 18 protein [Sistotremastrum niveocremeum HHB9708]|uniref:Glycoside hydrolase family 18 protein n=1 Tax=Sistotremastrum niveocremeum HHB9708 TaxID=1314777 RepID=A0A164PLX7_9AGAM|nr:glycoside hydrolase family 18 protein [Sistotremastrum niveocremeum HHB9708]